MKSTIERLYRKATGSSDGYFEFYIDDPSEVISFIGIGTNESIHYAKPGINWNGHKPKSATLDSRASTVEAWINGRRNLAENSKFEKLVAAYDDLGKLERDRKLDETGTYEYHFVYVPKSILSEAIAELYPVNKNPEKETPEVPKDVLGRIDFTKLYLEFEKKYNLYPVQMSRADAFMHAYQDGIITDELLDKARIFYGSLWNYVGD